jgi:hypothetical protein
MVRGKDKKYFAEKSWVAEKRRLIFMTNGVIEYFIHSGSYV